MLHQYYKDCIEDRHWPLQLSVHTLARVQTLGCLTLIQNHDTYNYWPLDIV